MRPPPEPPVLLAWQLLEGGEVLATFALGDGRRAQLLVADQQLTVAQVAQMAALAGVTVPPASDALRNVA